MKIKLPIVVAERVGTAYKFGTNIIYNCPNRPNVYNDAREFPVIERRLSTVTVFDRDLRIAGRAAALGRMGLFAAACTFAFAAAVPYVVVKMAADVIEWTCERLGDLLNAAGVNPNGIRSTFARLAREVVR